MTSELPIPVNLPDEGEHDDDESLRSSTIVVPAEELFGSAREVIIEHAGTRYRLRITRRNKLILQK